MASDISFSGLASGIDTASIIDKLMFLERRPLQALQDKISINDSKKNVYSTLNTRLSVLKDVVKDFDDVLDPFFEQKKVSSSESTVAGATITGTYPAIGNFSIDVSALATAAMVNGSAALYTGADNVAQSAVFQSASVINAPAMTVDSTQTLVSESSNFATAPAAAGTIEINGVTINWTDNQSLNEIIGDINNSNAGVTAAFDSVAQTFSLTSTATGADAEIILSQSAGNFLEAMNLTAGTAVGTDAVVPDINKAVGTAAANLDIAVTSGTFTINNVIFNVDATTDTMQTILGRINNSNAGVTASYDTSTHQVALFQKETGSSKQIVLGASGDTSNLLYALKLSPTNPPVGGAGDTYSGSDATLSLNGGADQTFSTNTVEGLIPGVSLDLKSVGQTAVNVERDVDSMVSGIKDFVDQYNTAMNFINSKLEEERIKDPKSLSQQLVGAFVGDTLFLEAKNDLISQVSQAASGISGDIKHLSQIGIDTTSDNFGIAGTLELDETKLRAVLQASPEKVEALFNDSSEGIMKNMETKLDSMTDSIYGSFVLQSESLTDINRDLNKRIESMEIRLEKRELSLKFEFSAMEGMVAQLNAMGSQLAAIMGQMG